METLPGMTGGRLSTDFAQVAFTFIKRMQDLRHVKTRIHDLPIYHQHLIESFQKAEAPLVKEHLEIDPDTQWNLQGRTIIVQREHTTTGYKFLNKKEKYDYFART